MSEAKITMQPHVSIPTADGNVAVVPASELANWAAGEAAEIGAEVLRAIVKNWLSELQAKSMKRKRAPRKPKTEQAA